MIKRTIILLVGLLGLGAGMAHASKAIYLDYTDAQGTVVAETDVNGTIVARYDYRPYGAPVSGALPNGPGYTGHVNDPDLGLVYMQARYYDPVVGRFLSTDPIAISPGNQFSFNRFLYVNGNPILNTDPNGMCGGNGEVSKEVQYMRDLADGCFGSSGNGTRDVSSGISEGKAWYHQYGGENDGDSAVCTTDQPWCNLQDAFAALKYYSFPGQNTSAPVENGQLSEISFLSIRGGHIQTFVDGPHHAVVNVTMGDHIFFNGYVIRSVVIKGTVLNIRTFGEGNNRGPFSWFLNKTTWEPGFGQFDLPLRTRMIQTWRDRQK